MHIKREVQAVMQALETAGFAAYAVGGAVRDSLLGKEPFDWDVTTAALPQQVMNLFGDNAIPTGLKHGTVTVLRGEERIEVTTYRRDGDYADHRHPVAVEFTPSLSEDLQRRVSPSTPLPCRGRGRSWTPLWDRQTCRQDCSVR